MLILFFFFFETLDLNGGNTETLAQHLQDLVDRAVGSSWIGNIHIFVLDGAGFLHQDLWGSPPGLTATAERADGSCGQEGFSIAILCVLLGLFLQPGAPADWTTTMCSI